MRRAEREIDFGRGKVLRPGDAVIELHLWNEHLPIPKARPDLRWAAAARKQFERSLDRLAIYVRSDPAFDEVRALMMMPALTSRQRAKNRGGVSYLLRGDWLAVRGRSGRSLFHRIVNDLWLWLLTYAFNPRSSARRHFIRHRQEFWIERNRFLAIYGVDGGGRRHASKPAALPPATSQA